MKRHAASRQKPVPKLASMSSLGPSFPETPSFTEGVIFTEVIGTTTSLKSWVCSTVEEGAIVEGLGKTFWAAAMGDRQEHAIKIGTISRKIIRCRPTLNQSVLMCCMCTSTALNLNTNDLIVFESAGLTKMERIACRSGKMVPIRTQWSDRLEAAIKGQPEESASSLSTTQTRRSPSVYAG